MCHDINADTSLNTAVHHTPTKSPIKSSLPNFWLPTFYANSSCFCARLLLLNNFTDNDTITQIWGLGYSAHHSVRCHGYKYPIKSAVWLYAEQYSYSKTRMFTRSKHSVTHTHQGQISLCEAPQPRRQFFLSLPHTCMPLQLIFHWFFQPAFLQLLQFYTY